MAIDETVRTYQTQGKPVTKKLDSMNDKSTVAPSNSVAMQFNDVKKTELNHGDCPGCMY